MKRPSVIAGAFNLQKLLRLLPQLWQKGVEPPASVADPEIRRRMRLFSGLLMMIIPVALVTFVAQYLFYPADNVASPSTLGPVAMAIAITVLFYLLNRVTASFRLLSYALTAPGFVAILTAAMTADPPHFQFVFLLFLPLFGTMLFSLRELFVLCLLTLLCLIVFAAPMSSMPRDLLKSLLVLLALAQAFILFVAQQGNQLEKDRQQLALVQGRNAFLNETIVHLSHDFRTPLTIINTSTFLLGQNIDPVKRQARADLISQQTSRPNSILDDILTVSRLNHMLEIMTLPQFSGHKKCPLD